MGAGLGLLESGCSIGAGTSGLMATGGMALGGVDKNIVGVGLETGAETGNIVMQLYNAQQQASAILQGLQSTSVACGTSPAVLASVGPSFSPKGLVTPVNLAGPMGSAGFSHHHQQQQHQHQQSCNSAQLLMLLPNMQASCTSMHDNDANHGAPGGIGVRAMGCVDCQVFRRCMR